MIAETDIAEAAVRIGPHIRRTALTVSEPLTERLGATIAIKAEHQQHTGSFKLRGALNKVLGLSAPARAAGVVTASSGNHGIATARAALAAETHCTVYLPATASAAKVAAIERLGADIITVASTNAYQAEVAARAAASEQGITYISPYNDPAVIAGQGTIGLELLEQAQEVGLGGVDVVVVAVGGGGLVSGVASLLAQRSPSTLVVGASPVNDRAMAASVAAGTIIEVSSSPTFSDGTAGGVEPGAITFELCRALVGSWVAVTESEIAGAVVAMIDDHQQLVEGAAGVAMAAAARCAADYPGARIVAVSCGANVSAARLAQMLDQAP